MLSKFCNTAKSKQVRSMQALVNTKIRPFSDLNLSKENSTVSTAV